MCQKQHCNQERRNDPRAELDLLEIAAENADHDIGDQTKDDAVRDIIGKGHDGKEKKVVIPAMNSVFTEVPRSFSLKPFTFSSPMQSGKDQSHIAPFQNNGIIIAQLQLKFKFFSTKKSHPIRPTMQKNTPEKRECF